MQDASRIIHRTLRATPPVAVRAEGLWIEDEQGNLYADACGGAAVSCLGHAHPAVVAAVREQVGRLEYVHTGFFSNRPAEDLADVLLTDAPSGLTHAYFVSGGSEAVEAALKLARQYFVERGEPGRTRFIARRQSYHGNTLGALAVGGNMARRAIYAPILMEASHVEPCFAYRFRREDETEEEYGQRAANSLEEEILRHPPGTVAAFLAETVVGATAGRCGTLHACTAEGIAPDILVVAKGLGAGFQPIGALLVSSAIIAALREGSGSFQHGHTYLSHPVACAAALAVQRQLREGGLAARVGPMGAVLADLLTERFGNHAHVGDIRGRGLFWSIELVEDRTSKRIFDPARKLHARVREEAMARGLLVYNMGGTIDGTRGDHVTLAPPFTVTEEELAMIVSRLGEAVDAACAA